LSILAQLETFYCKNAGKRRAATTFCFYADMILCQSPEWDWARFDSRIDVYSLIQVSALEYENVRLIRRDAIEVTTHSVVIIYIISKFDRTTVPNIKTLVTWTCPKPWYLSEEGPSLMVDILEGASGLST